MYDYEINQYMAERNYNLSNKEYIYICNTCPQINHVKYDAWSNRFEMWSDQGNHWSFSVYKENME